MKSTKTLLLILLSIWPAYSVICQSDTNRIATIQNNFSVQGKYLDRNKLWLLNLTGEFMNYEYDFITRYGLNTSVEYRLLKKNTLKAGLGISMIDQISFYPTEFLWNVGLNLNVEYRYYYNLTVRMSKGLTGKNFNANYFLVSPYVNIGYESTNFKNYEWDFESGTWKIVTKSRIKAYPGIKVGYGIQRTLGNRINIDFQGGLLLHNYPYGNSDPLALLYFQINAGYILNKR